MKTKTSPAVFAPRISTFVSSALVTAALLALPSFAPAATLVAQWDMNEGSGTTLTSTFPTGPGTESELLTTAGATWSGSAGAAPGSTGYLNFDGSAACCRRR